MSKPLIVNVFGIDSGMPRIGSAIIVMDAWTKMGLYGCVIMINTGRNYSIVEKKGASYIEIRMPTFKFSDNQIVTSFVYLIFRSYAPHILLNLDSFVFSLTSLLRFRPLLVKSTHIHTYHFWFVFLASFLPSLRKKMVYTELGGEWVELAQKRASWLVKLRYGVLGKTILSRIRVIAQSQLNKDYMVRCGIPKQNVVVVRHARSDPTIFFPKAPKAIRPFRVLFVGRIVPQKGLHVLVDASNILINERGLKDITFTIVGPVGGFGLSNAGLYYYSLIKKIKELKLSGFYTFKGNVELEELVRMFSMANVCVQPSLQDALPSTVTEAQMCGTPVIVTNSGGMVELVEDGVTGFIIPVNDCVDLADKLEYLYSNRSVCELMGKKARQRALALFSADEFARDLYEGIIFGNNKDEPKTQSPTFH